MHRNVLGAVLVLAVVASCASSSSSIPEVSIAQITPFSEFQVRVESGLPMDYRLTIDNPSDHAVTLMSVEVETVGTSGGYAMNRVRHAFSRQIPAKSSDSVEFRAWVQPLTRDQKGDVSSPVLLRGTARFETPYGIVRRNFANRGQ
jgi:hypothetical protein